MMVKEKSDVPPIETYYSGEGYREAAQLAIKRVAEITYGAPNYDALFSSESPVFCISPLEEVPGSISLYLLTRYRKNAFRFFFDMISKWMVPGAPIEITLFYAVDFHIPTFNDEQYTVMEIKLSIQSREEYEKIRRNVQLLAPEVKLGVGSSYFARTILESKGLGADEKMEAVQDHILRFAERHKGLFEEELFQEMQQMMVLCSDGFKNSHDSVFLAKLVAYSYLFRKNIREEILENPGKRHLNFKIFRRLSTEKGKKILGFLVAVHFKSEKEVFEERHLLKTIQSYGPQLTLVDGSVFAVRHPGDPVGLLYLEVEGEVDHESLLQMREELPDELKNRVEHRMHPIFMPRNDEEIMRNVLSLGEQIKFTTDLPQVFVTFDEQTDSHLFFTIIFVQVLKETDRRVEDRFAKADTFLEYFPDFTKVLGLIRKKYQKEASVFRVKLTKEMFLRDDHSIDLNKARYIVVTELERILGRFRDFNGGMISKQNELLAKVRSELAEEGISNDLLLENFYYSLMPATLRSVLDSSYITTLFNIFLSALDERKPFSAQRGENVLYVVITSESPEVKKEVGAAVAKLNLTRGELATFSLTTSGVHCLGYLFKTEDPYRQQHFLNTVEGQFL